MFYKILLAIISISNLNSDDKPAFLHFDDQVDLFRSRTKCSALTPR